MGQYDVLEFINKHPRKWWSIEALAEALHVTKQQVTNATLKLKKFKMVDFSERPVKYKKWQGKRFVYHFRAKNNGKTMA